MLKIRLQRVGRRNDPNFRVVLTDSKNGPRSGKFLEVLGSYNPRGNAPTFNSDRVRHWLSKGVYVWATIHNFLVVAKITEGEKINVLPRKSPVKKEEREAKRAPSEPTPPSSNEIPVADVQTPKEAPVEEKPPE